MKQTGCDPLAIYTCASRRRNCSQLRHASSFLRGQRGHAPSLLATYRAELAAPFVQGEFTRGAAQLLQLRYVKVPRYLERRDRFVFFFFLSFFPPKADNFVIAHRRFTYRSAALVRTTEFAVERVLHVGREDGGEALGAVSCSGLCVLKRMQLRR